MTSPEAPRRGRKERSLRLAVGFSGTPQSTLPALNVPIPANSDGKPYVKS